MYNQPSSTQNQNIPPSNSPTKTYKLGELRTTNVLGTRLVKRITNKMSVYKE